MPALEIIFWTCALAMMHSYVFYPLLLRIFAIGKKPNQDVFRKNAELPEVTIIIPACNEEAVIAEKLKSIFNSDYPGKKIEVLVGSDASTDQTNEIVKSLKDKFPNIHLIEFAERSGKATIVNRLASSAKNAILILTDANVLLGREAIYELVKHFHNKKIGLVDSNMLHKGMRKEGISNQETKYIQSEVKIKNNEGLIWGTMMGPFGGCFAVRKSFFVEIPSNFLVDDFYINMRVLEKGGTAINELNAAVYEDVSNDLFEELKRKIRIATGNWQNFFTFFHLLFRFNGLSFSFFSHKVLRWLGPLFLITIFAVTFPLMRVSDIYCMIFFLELGIIVLPALDIMLKKIHIHIFFLRLATHFFTMNLGLLFGLFRFIGGVKSGAWNPTRRNQ